MNDHKLVKYLFILLALPVGLAMCSGDRFRYPCQDPANWDKDICKMPICDVTRTCPEHIFKGQKDPRVGVTTVEQNATPVPKPATPASGECK